MPARDWGGTVRPLPLRRGDAPRQLPVGATTRPLISPAFMLPRRGVVPSGGGGCGFVCRDAVAAKTRAAMASMSSAAARGGSASPPSGAAESRRLVRRQAQQLLPKHGRLGLWRGRGQRLLRWWRRLLRRWGGDEGTGVCCFLMVAERGIARYRDSFLGGEGCFVGYRGAMRRRDAVPSSGAG